MAQIYDEIGVGYSGFRRPDPRIASAILDALGEAKSVVNVGAGAGSYEPVDRTVVAVEPSREMIDQRTSSKSLLVQASSARLPFKDAVFDAGLAILTIHHWSNRMAALAEFARVVQKRLVIVTWDPESSGFWLDKEYFPEILAIDRQIFPTRDDFRRVLGSVEVRELPIPHDCTDGFLGAYWRRPAAYLNPEVRFAISTFAKVSNVDPGLVRLKKDLVSGQWKDRFGYHLEQTELDLGYRIIIANFDGT